MLKEITVPVIVDTTLAPLYPVFARDFAAAWPFLLVKSGSKYFTKGKATLGVAFVGDDEEARGIIADATQTTTTFSSNGILLAASQATYDSNNNIIDLGFNSDLVILN